MSKSAVDFHKREFCVRQTLANFSMEGEYPSLGLKKMFDDFVQGKFGDVAEMKKVYCETHIFNQVDINMLNALDYGVRFAYR